MALVSAGRAGEGEEGGQARQPGRGARAAPLPPATAAIGHTRWATHGGPTDANAHPHLAGKLAVIHNGIVENFDALKASCWRDGVVFRSETDTEVVAHLLAGGLRDRAI